MLLNFKIQPIVKGMCLVAQISSRYNWSCTTIECAFKGIFIGEHHAFEKERIVG